MQVIYFFLNFAENGDVEKISKYACARTHTHARAHHHHATHTTPLLSRIVVTLAAIPPPGSAGIIEKFSEAGVRKIAAKFFVVAHALT